MNSNKCMKTMRAFCLLGLSFFSLTASAEQFELLAKAQPDECFYGVGSPNNEFPIIGNCQYPAKLKKNEAYVWSMTKYDDDIYFGTVVSPNCSLYFGLGTSFANNDFVCEGRKSVFGSDNRPPGIYRYNVKSKELVSLIGSLDSEAEELRQQVYGLRAAEHHKSVVLLAGPGIKDGIVYDGLIFFAFDAQTGEFIDSIKYDEYSNVRKGIVASDGYLYFGVSTAEKDGAILRWTGNIESPFEFEVVGIGLDGDAVELVEHEGRILVTTWPRSDARNQKGGGLWMSPPLDQISSKTESKMGWIRLWSASDYDPDPVTARTYGGGALASFDGWLYWGTMHIPFIAAGVHIDTYNYPLYSWRMVPVVPGTWRASSVFRARNFANAKPEIQLLYGGSEQRSLPPGSFPAYLCPFNLTTCNPYLRTWRIVPNKMGLKPLYGRGGLGNPYNTYIWTMALWKDRLYVGTMDENPLKTFDENVPKALRNFSSSLRNMTGGNAFGADLFRFNDSESPAIPVNIDGVGNSLNIGHRIMVPDGDDSLLLGTASLMNLDPKGGWELIKVTD